MCRGTLRMRSSTDEVGDALLLQALNQPVARARGRHADAGEAIAVHASAPEPAAQSVERGVVGEIDRQRRDGDIAFGDRVKVRAGSRVLAGARRPHPVHRTAARIFGLDHRFGAMPIAETRDLDALHGARRECSAR